MGEAKEVPPAEETDAEAIARLKAENKQLKKGLKSNLRMLGELEQMYEEEKQVMQKHLDKSQNEKATLQEELEAAQAQVNSLQVQIACQKFDENNGSQPFWNFMKEMEQVSKLVQQKIKEAKKEAEANGGQRVNGLKIVASTDDEDEEEEDDEFKFDEKKVDSAMQSAGMVPAAATTTALANPKRRNTFAPGTRGPTRGAPEPADFDPQVMARRRGSVMTGMAKFKRGIVKLKVAKSFDHKEKFTSWSGALRRSDPRYQILAFFDQIAKKGKNALSANCEITETGVCTQDCLPAYDPTKREAGGIFHLAGVFTVWRPTSLDSIRRMMIGEGVGKGLDIKGKSAKKGHLSAFVPFLQLHDERHKHMVRTIPVLAKLRVFYNTQKTRDHAHAVLLGVAKEMKDGYQESQDFLAELQRQEENDEWDLEDEALLERVDAQREECYAKWMWELDPEDEMVANIDDYAPKKYGMVVSQRVFFETYVMRGNCHREPGSMHDTGRNSEPAFQDMNMETLKKGASEDREDKTAPRPVLMQYTSDEDKTLDPRYLLIAYEERGKVTPVVSDFDCFLVGTRRINFDQPMPPSQIDLMKWCIAQIEKILAFEPSSETWTMRWLENLKEQYQKGFHVDLPKYGFADPKSYSMMAHAVDRLSTHGSVRHGAECFNYYFPQDLDDEFLVVTNNQVNGPWVKYTKDGLLQFLSDKIDEGFMFPLNPKWVLCDPGWMKLWDKQMATTNESAKKALASWYPPGCGVRESIERIHKTYPNAFQVIKDKPYSMANEKYSPLRHAREKGHGLSTEDAVHMALMEVEHDRVLRKALKAVRAIMFANRMRRALTPRQRESIRRHSSMAGSKSSVGGRSGVSRSSAGSFASLMDMISVAEGETDSSEEEGDIDYSKQRKERNKSAYESAMKEKMQQNGNNKKRAKEQPINKENKANGTKKAGPPKVIKAVQKVDVVEYDC